MGNRLISTYRLQVNKDFTLRDAAAAVPHLKSLGISHIYLSPILESTKGSLHGYDICDFTKISGERGGEDAFAELDRRCLENDMGIILDIVPNHMGIAGENPFWIDVLAKGRQSEHSILFDLRVGEDGKIHLPVLDKPLEEMIASGEAKYGIHARYGRVLTIGSRVLPLSHENMNEECYALVQWTEAFDKISYRRFFDITDLIGIRVEDRNVYDATHRFLFDLCRKYRSVYGMRVDHIDGLADPATYLGRLHNDVRRIWVEKILSGDESLPKTWNVKGTTGYEFVARINDVMVDPAGFEKIRAYWHHHIENRWSDFNACVRESKSDILDSLFPSEMKRLVELSKNFGTAAQAELFWRGITVSLDIYRTYGGEHGLSSEDRRRITDAAGRARKWLGRDFEEAERIFLPPLLEAATPRERKILREWQQLSGPAMAKGLEDCAHYRYTPLAALNEVGCEAAVRNGGIERYHTWASAIAKNYPDTLLATSTHDTKRSEDVRARLYVLSDRPDAWIEYCETSAVLNKAYRNAFNIHPATEYFFYQAAVGLWPWDGEINGSITARLCDYMQKSVKEARIETSWLKPDKDYEERLKKFVRATLSDQDFIRHTDDFVATIAPAGVINALSVLTLKILGPGVPDFYQGSEEWNFTLVDPDNRRTADFNGLRKTQEDILKHPLQSLVRNWQSPALKLWYTRNLLNIRAGYCHRGKRHTALSVFGQDANHIIAYETCGLIVFCPRLAGKLSLSGIGFKIRAHAELPAGHYRNLLTEERYSIRNSFDLENIFTLSPVAVLRREE